MRIRLGVPGDLNKDETAAVLDAALEAVTAANEPLIARGKIPHAVKAIKRGVKWRPEPPGDEHFDLASTVLKRGHGDCDDLAPYLAASLRASGEDPEAYAYVRPTGPNRWHAVVNSQGRELDPSRWAGMGARVSGDDNYRAPFWPPMFGDRLSVAAYPLYSGWAGRVDVPDDDEMMPIVWSHLAKGTSPRSAVRGAICGVQIVGRCNGEDELTLAGLEALLAGAHPEQVDQALEANGAVGFLPFLAPAAASLAAPIASKALGMFGGGGGGGGSAAASAPPHPGVAPPGATMTLPGGPIIVRF